MLDFSEMRSRLSRIKLSELGDYYEQSFGSFIQLNLSNYEEFWKLIVFPFRTDDNTQNPLNLSLNVPRNHETVCIYSYSIFRSCLKIEHCLEAIRQKQAPNNDILSEDFDNCVLWINIGYNQLNMLGISVLNTFLMSPPTEIIDIRKLGDENTSSKYLKYCIRTYDKNLLKRIKSARDAVAAIRNFVAHGPKFPGYNNLIPKPEYIEELIQWTDFHRYRISNPHDTREMLMNRVLFAYDSSLKFYELANELWQYFLKLIEAKFVSVEFPNESYINSIIKNTADPAVIVESFKKSLTAFFAPKKSITTNSGIQGPQASSGLTF